VTRHAGWLAGVTAAVAFGVLAVVVPSSWWGGAFAAAVVFALVAARPVVSAAYAPSWTRTTVVVGALAVAFGVLYASVVPPWGPRPGVYVPLALVLALVALAVVADTPMARWGGRLTDYRTVEHADRSASRRRYERY